MSLSHCLPTNKAQEWCDVKQQCLFCFWKTAQSTFETSTKNKPWELQWQIRMLQNTTPGLATYQQRESNAHARLFWALYDIKKGFWGSPKYSQNSPKPTGCSSFLCTSVGFLLLNKGHLLWKAGHSHISSEAQLCHFRVSTNHRI